MPDSASIKISFQAAPANAFGEPDLSMATPETSDISFLSDPSMFVPPYMVPNTDFRFFRFIVRIRHRGGRLRSELLLTAPEP